MPGRRSATDRFVLPPRPRGTPAIRWLCDAVRSAIAEGRLRPGARLESSRRLAAQAGVARRTVIAAFEELQSHGYLDTQGRTGTFVAMTAGDRADRQPAAAPRRSARAARPPRLSQVGRRVVVFERFGQSSPLAFRAHLPALDLFPTDVWARVVGRRLRRATAAHLTGAGPLGYAPLRAVIADYLGRSRGVRCTPDQLLIVSGVQEALGLIARLLVDPGDAVCMEDPGYPGAARVFEAAGARIVPVPVDEQGMRVPKVGPGGARLAYVTPAHQFPLGTSMSLARRLRLLAWARATGSVIVEDDYDSEYRYGGRPLPALHGLDRDDVVVFVGSFSKVLFPSLRLGYLVAPRALIEPLSALLTVEGRQPPVTHQAALCDFIGDGHFLRHVRRMRQVYGERLATLQARARATLGGRLDVSAIEAGLQTSARLRGTASASVVASLAAARGVEVTPLSRYARRPMAFEGLLLGFAAIDAPEIVRGVDELARVLSRL